ncbi:hypothetical protein GEMRC1_008379 [Eukaryota sp. GEM-RC1]
MTKPLSICVYGTGAVGLFYSSYLLSCKKCNVHFLLRSDYDAVKDNGITMNSDVFPDMRFDTSAFSFYKDPSDIKENLDFVLICSKTLYNQDIITNVLPKLLQPNTAIVVLQNGLDNEIAFAQAFPSNPVLGGIAFVCATRTAPGVVHHVDRGGLLLGPHNCSMELVHKFAGLYEGADIDVHTTEDLRTARFKKLVWNVIFNGLSVVLSADTSQLTSLDRLRSVEQLIGNEVIRVAQSVGCEIPSDFVANGIAVTQKMAKYKTSMLVDYEAKRPLELEYLFYKLLQVADDNNVSVPMCTLLTAQLEFLDSTNRSE